MAHLNKGIQYIPKLLPNHLINTKQLNLNFAGDEVLSALNKLLREKKIAEYRQVEYVLN
jgi:hypothetical protein